MGDNAVAIVTGAASGLGRASAAELNRRGYRVVVADLDREAACETAESLAAESPDARGRPHPMQVDVTDFSSVTAMVAAVAALGELRVAVNNAGVAGEGVPVSDYSLDGWRSLMQVNLDGVFHCMKAEIPLMREAGGGSIVNMASVLGTVGRANASAYVAAKHAVLGLTKSAALECAVDGIRVNAVAPGFVITPLNRDRLDADARRDLAGSHALGRLGTAEEVAHVVGFLAGEESSFVTGSCQLVDGGYSAH